MTHQITFRVYYEDTDAGGVVYHTNYPKFAERARTEFLRELGFDQSALKDDLNLIFVVSKQNIIYKKPAKLDDLLTIESTVSNIKKASFFFEQNILACKGDVDSVLCTLQTQVAAINAEKFSPMSIPQIILERLGA